MKYRHSDKGRYDDVIKCLRTYNMEDFRNQELVYGKMESLLATYGYTVEYDKASNIINNYLNKKRGNK